MKKFYPILFLFISIFFAACNGCKSNKENEYSVGHEYDFYVKVVGVSDGDTFTGITDENEEIRFRIYGIDAPEWKQPYSNKSKQYLSDLIYNKKVGIVVQKQSDQYNRPIVWVYTPDGDDVGAEMLKAGMAWHFKRFDNSENYKTLEENAKTKKNGLWSDKNPIAPWEFRAK